MTAFDPMTAKQDYADKPSEELVRIAYLEENYLPEAVDIAIQELDQRNLSEPRKKLIARVRREDKRRRREVAMAPQVARGNFVDAVLKAKRGKPRRLYLFVVVPIILFIAGLIWKLAE